MVRPGMINLDFADVETVMSSMGKAIWELEKPKEKIELWQLEMALNNPLIDEYSLKGTKRITNKYYWRKRSNF